MRLASLKLAPNTQPANTYSLPENKTYYISELHTRDDTSQIKLRRHSQLFEQPMRAVSAVYKTWPPGLVWNFHFHIHCIIAKLPLTNIWTLLWRWRKREEIKNNTNVKLADFKYKSKRLIKITHNGTIVCVNCESCSDFLVNVHFWCKLQVLRKIHI